MEQFLNSAFFLCVVPKKILLMQILNTYRLRSPRAPESRVKGCVQPG